jgi:hypothetical protein
MKTTKPLSFLSNKLFAVRAVACAVLAAAVPLRAQQVLLEAEQFARCGGWDVDQQSMDQMGSPYLLAHGLGVPVRDAVTAVRLPAAGAYRVWVRTRDWVAPWKGSGEPGKFQVVVDGKPLAKTFGVAGEAWHWEDGGLVEVAADATVALHDLTGFEGRCDAVLFCKDTAFQPPNEPKALEAFRRAALGLPEKPEDGGSYDLVVVGGGIAGTAAALSAARNGLFVALVQDRPVLGGNGSSEVRVWPQGATRKKPYRNVGDIVGELVSAGGPGCENAGRGECFGDDRKLSLVKAEPRITLLLEQRVNGVETRDGRIVAVIAQHTRTARRIRIAGALFADCTGDGTVGFLAGADYEITKEGRMGASNLWNLLDQADTNQVLHCECKDKDALASSVQAGNTAAPFPRCPWAVDLSDKPFPGRDKQKKDRSVPPFASLGGWFWESGFDKDSVNDIERIRDLNMRAMYGAWDALKNVDGLYPNYRLGWSAYIAGKRESRRLLGDVILTGDDFRQGKAYPDGCFPCTWHIDLHMPAPAYAKGHEGDEFISYCTSGKDYSYKGPYWAPYRCLYSRNIGNLFMAGRDISVNREAIGPTRVMKTCGMMGEIVGKAAWICVRHKTTPRGVYERHLDLLKTLMRQPGALRRETLEGELALPPGAQGAAYAGPGLDPAKLPGLVIDDTGAELTGDWSDTGTLTGFVGEGYAYSSDAKATATFPFTVKEGGLYEVRVAWQPHANRAKAAQITVLCAEGAKAVTVNQTQAPTGANGFGPIGTFRFEAGKPASVLFTVAGSRGAVHIDAVQLVPAGGSK